MSLTISTPLPSTAGGLLIVWLVLSPLSGAVRSAEPPVIDPFGQRRPARDDALPGYLETSDGAVQPGQIYLTRDKRLMIFDEKLQRQREIPLRAVKRIECKVKREWMEKQWRFKEAASSEKVYTGRAYPVREYLHTITLRDDRKITGPLSAIIYVRPDLTPAGKPGRYPRGPEPQRYLLYKRSKGKLGKDLESLIYVKLICLGEDALAEGTKKAAARRAKKTKSARPEGSGN
jgi:hypothetical protein